MSAVESVPTGRRCPRCGTAMTEQQEWCLSCGAAVGTRVVAARGWRAPLVIAAALAALGALAVILAIAALADDTERVAEAPAAPVGATPTPPPATTPAPTSTPAAGDPTADPTATATADPTATPDADAAPAEEWPAGESGWTVVLSSETSRSSADAEAVTFAGQGIAGVGVLRSSDFPSLKPGFWVVFAGRYGSQSEAADALDGIDARDAYIRRIVPG